MHGQRVAGDSTAYSYMKYLHSWSHGGPIRGRMRGPIFGRLTHRICPLSHTTDTVVEVMFAIHLQHHRPFVYAFPLPWPGVARQRAGRSSGGTRHGHW